MSENHHGKESADGGEDAGLVAGVVAVGKKYRPVSLSLHPTSSSWRSPLA